MTLAEAEAHLAAGRLAEAEQGFRAVLAADPGHAGARTGLARLALAVNRPDAALDLLAGGGAEARLLRAQALTQLAEAAPADAGRWIRLADALAGLGDADGVHEAHVAALAADPAASAVRWRLGRVLPRVYQSEAEIAVWRRRYATALAILDRTTSLDSPARVAEAVRGLALQTNFELGYQGGDDLPLQRLFGGLAARIMAAALPELAAPPAPRPGSGRIRVGYVSSFFTSHTIGLLFAGWILAADRDRFAVHVYLTGGEADRSTAVIARNCDLFRDLRGDLGAAARAIRGDGLDVLVYPDLGMDTRSFMLAALRLAPVQCVSWGHPVTTGLPTIDHFLSCGAMEPPDGDSHYSEHLVRLPGLSIHYNPAELPQRKGREAFGLPAGAILYLCCQAQQKYLPQYDALFPAIAARVPAARFVFVEHRSLLAVNRRFRERLVRAFRASGLDPERHLVFLPWQPWEDFLDLAGVCDVFLDSIGWSGGNTTLEALSRGLPPVTLPTRFMRGRHTFAMLSLMEAGALIARDAAHYVGIAVRLGAEPEFRAAQRALVAARRDRLYRDIGAVRALEAFFRSVVPS
ncbi:MAG: tetratricopeptide repeat protein [Caulobacter sp.]|nr:tetratricopeptide repeat protein [Caulobacter sp.]